MINIKIKSIIKVFIILSIILVCYSCKKIIAIDSPIDRQSGSEVFNDRNSAIAAVTGIFNRMENYGDGFSGVKNISFLGGVLSDEMEAGVSDPGLFDFYLNNMPSSDPSGYWNAFYASYIFRTNSIIEGVTKSKSLDKRTRTRIIAEAKFLRAFYYFYLVNFYGEVPLVLSTDFKQNSNIGRSSVDVVYDQIIEDLKNAEAGLTENYLASDLLTSTSERIRPNKFAAESLLARIFLYRRDWKNAEDYSSKVIANKQYRIVQNLNNVFLKNSDETIWQLQPNQLDQELGVNTLDGQYLIPYPGDIPKLYASYWLLSSFENTDLRRNNWLKADTVGSLVYVRPDKYKIGIGSDPSIEYTMVIRLAELYLIRAEARNELGNAGGAKDDLNVIRQRAGLGTTTANTQSSIAVAIQKERQVELFAEWSNRWLDLKRSNLINNVMKGVCQTKMSYGGIQSTWASYKALFPIPTDQFKINPALRGHQNPGYTE